MTAGASPEVTSFASRDPNAGVILEPGGGSSPSGMAVRMVIQPLPCFAGSINEPTNSAPGSRRITSPACAPSTMRCKSPPRATASRRPVGSWKRVSRYTRGSSGGPVSLADDTRGASPSESSPSRCCRRPLQTVDRAISANASVRGLTMNACLDERLWRHVNGSRQLARIEEAEPQVEDEQSPDQQIVITPAVLMFHDDTPRRGRVHVRIDGRVLREKSFDAVAQRVAEPVTKRQSEALLGPIEQLPWYQSLECLAEEPFAFAVSHREVRR